MNDSPHISVFKRELVDSLALKPGDVGIDCTAGRGGHTREMLNIVGPAGQVLALDRDPEAIAYLQQHFSAPIAEKQLLAVKTRFSQLSAIAEQHNLKGKVAGICADVGVSSPQIDTPERGFSFRHAGPLDMRMDPSPGQRSAADVINEADEKELARIFWQLGEEPKSRFIAQAIVKERVKSPITDTLRLADIVEKAVFYKEKSRKHPATKVFQALRIYVNEELEELEKLIEQSLDILRPGGRLAIISFHSLEDRLVKRQFEKFTGKSVKVPRDLPLTPEEIARVRNQRAAIIKPFPMEPSAEELASNPRSRSAKLRVLEKLQ